VPAADEPRADRLPAFVNEVRETLYNLRYRWLDVRVGGPDASMNGQWVVLSVAMVAVFACFFAIGRLGHGGGVSPAPAPSAQLSPAQSAVPIQLSGESPIAGAVPVAIAVRPREPTAQSPAVESARRIATPARSVTTEPSRIEVLSASRPASVQESQTSEAAPQLAPRRAAAPQRRPGKSTPARRHAAPAKSKPSTGVTFDSSE
jgi:hypothetical protein